MPPEPDRVQGIVEDQERKGDQQALLNSAQEAVDYARRYDPTRLVSALTRYTRLLVRDGQYEQARSYALEILQVEQDSPSAVEATIALGVCAAQTNQIDLAELCFQQAADLSRKINYLLGLARAMQYQTKFVLLPRGKFQLALSILEEASHLFEEEGSPQAYDPFLCGLVYQITGQRILCRRVLDDLLLRIEPGTRLAAAYYLLWARLAVDERELEQAIEYLSLGLRIANRMDVLDLNVWFRLEYSRYHRFKNEAPVARAWAEEALHQAVRRGSHYFTGMALIERAETYWESGEPVLAEKDLDEAFQLLEPLQAAYKLTRIRYLRALWHRQLNHPQAEADWQAAVQMIMREGYTFLLEREQERAFPLVAAYLRSKTPALRATTESLMRRLANVPPPPLRIATLGQFSVWKGRQRIPDAALSRRKAGDLFRYLLLQPNRTAGREVIIEALWYDHTSDNPSDLLHQASSALRHALEPDLPDKFPSRYLKVEGEQITLQLPLDSVVDFEQFERALPVAIQGRNADWLQEALNLYSGELFPSDRYADWSVEKRQSLADLRQRGLISLASVYLDQAQYYNVINCVRQILHSDGWNEDAVILGMQAYVGLQNIPQALLMYQQVESTLQSELGISPRPDLRELAEALRKR